MSSNKFIKGMLIGALVGGAVTLFDKEVRIEIAEKSKKYGKKTKAIIQNPGASIKNLQSKIHEFKTSYENLNEDLQFIVEKASEIKELSQEAAKAVTETKEKLRR